MGIYRPESLISSCIPIPMNTTEKKSMGNPSFSWKCSSSNEPNMKNSEVKNRCRNLSLDFRNLCTRIYFHTKKGQKNNWKLDIWLVHSTFWLSKPIQLKILTFILFCCTATNIYPFRSVLSVSESNKKDLNGACNFFLYTQLSSLFLCLFCCRTVFSTIIRRYP